MITGPNSIRVILASSLVVALTFAFFAVGGSAHAELSLASPPAAGTVTALPASLILKFTEEVTPGSVTVQVTGPAGARVDTGDAAVDLTDPDRLTVTVPLFAGGAGTYNVHWETISNIDGDAAAGDYSFTVSPRVNSGSPMAPATPSSVITPTPDPDLNGNPLTTEDSFDDQAFALSIGAGLLALLVIVGLWFAIRPRDAKFGFRPRKD